jgi:hypothetical protein
LGDREFLGPAGKGVHGGERIAQETWGGSTLLDGTYFGNTSTGNLWTTFETAMTTEYGGIANSPMSVTLDSRPTQVKHVRDNLAWWELFSYECMRATSGGRGNVDAGSCGGYRSSGNTIQKQIAADGGNAPGAVLAPTKTTYFHNGSYDQRNIVRLPAQVQQITGGATGPLLTQTVYGYDENKLTPSQQPGLDTTYTNAFRGNVTTTQQYSNISTGASVSSHHYYFDNGVLQRTQDPNGNWPSTVTAADFGACSATHATVSTQCRMLWASR